MNTDNKSADQVQPQAPVTPISTVGGSNKEAVRVTAPVSEFVKPSGAEIAPNIPPEVSKAQVVEVKTEPNLTSEHIEIGIKPSGPTVPVSTNPTGLVKIPEEEDTDVSNSRTWFNALWNKVLKWGNE